MQFTVSFTAEVDVEGWAAEYHHESAAAALTDVLTQLRYAHHYLHRAMWEPFATVSDVTAQVVVFPPAANPIPRLDATSGLPADDAEGAGE